MKTTDTFRQYIWLINVIQRAGRITFKRIGDQWMTSSINENKPLSRTTFYRLRQSLEDMFGVHIECDDQHQYFISNPESLRSNSTENWMLRTLTVNSMLLDGLSIKDQLLLEDIPTGLDHIETIINAIKCHHTLQMGYQKFTDSVPYITSIEPYCLKLFHQRWYLLGKSKKKGGNIAIYALDRMTELTETKTQYELAADFDAETYFKNYFGVFIGDEPPAQRIVLRAYCNMPNLLRTLPLHHSQKEICKTDSYADFEYYLAPTFDFRQAILKEGDELEVIEPISLRNQILLKLKSTINRYK